MYNIHVFIKYNVIHILFNKTKMGKSSKLKSPWSPWQNIWLRPVLSLECQCKILKDHS